MNILELLSQDNFIMYNITLANKIGIYESILIGELARKFNYWTIQNRLTEDGYFFITQEDIEKDTGLTKYQQRMAFKHLEELGIIDIKKKGGTDRSNYYKVFDHALLKYLTFQGQKSEPSKVKKVNDTKTINTKTIYTTTNTNKETVPVLEKECLPPGDKEGNIYKAPTVEEVRQYAMVKFAGKNSNWEEVDWQRFIDYYEAVDWKDSNGKPIIWKQKVLYWVENQKTKKSARSSAKFIDKHKSISDDKSRFKPMGFDSVSIPASEFDRSNFVF